MGAEDSWQERAAPRRTPQRRQRAWEDRGGLAAQRSRLMLIGGGALLVVAVLVARSMPQQPGAAVRPAVAMAPAVIAVAGIGFGEKLSQAKLKLIDVPAKSLPAGHFARVEPLILGDGRTTLRPIAANEILIETALVAGATRLSTAPLLHPAMRALALRVDEVGGVSGLVFPGDRVDVFMTRQPDEAMPHAELLAQNLRVLAVGSDMNIARDKPGVVKTMTLEVNPVQGQKLTLAMAAGSISLALRQFSDENRVRLESLQVSDLNDGTPTRLVKKPGSGPAPAPPARPATAARPARSVIVLRGGVASPDPVLP